MKVSIIVTNYNGEDLLEKNLEFVVKAAGNKKNNIIEVLVADDASTDGSRLVAKRFGLKFVTGETRQGYSVNVNRAVKRSGGELVCVLNNDVRPEESLLESIGEIFEDGVFAVTLHEKGRGWARGKFEDGFVGHEAGPESKGCHISFWANGGSSVFRKSCWKDLGGFDEELMSPFYWEDLDISYRAWKRGWRILWDPEAIVLHDHESTMKKLDQKYLRRVQETKQLLFMWKNITSRLLFRKHLFGLVIRVLRNPGYLRIVAKALLKLPVVIRKRRVEKKQSRVSDESVLAQFSHE